MADRSKNPDARLAARWIDQRLAEMVRHYQPLVESLAAAFDERHPIGSLDQRERHRKRQSLATQLENEREDVIRAADRLLRLRSELGDGADVPPVPRETLAHLSELRAKHEEHMERVAAELDWLDNAVEYEMERLRAWHDDDTPPDPAEYGLRDDEPAVEEGE